MRPVLPLVLTLVLVQQVASNGKYQSLPSKSNNFLIVSIEPPKIRPFSFPPRSPIGSIVAAMCTVSSGSQPLTFQWLKNGRELTSSSTHLIGTSLSMATLEIPKVQEFHDGNYTCRVSNSFGSDSLSAKLEVEGTFHHFNLNHN